MPRLVELATTVRSKNAGVDHITFDIIFSDPAAYDRAVSSHAISRELIARLYDIPLHYVTHLAYIPAARAIKFTLKREWPSGSPGETDVFGSQQYAPLFDIEVP